MLVFGGVFGRACENSTNLEEARSSSLRLGRTSARLKDEWSNADLAAVVRSVSDGTRLMRASFELVRGDRSLLWYPVISTACLAVTAAFWIFEGAYVYAFHGSTLLYVPLVIVGLYSLAFVGIFFNVALAGAAAEVIEGGEPSFGDGINIAWMRFGCIAGWAAYSISVSIVIGFAKSINRWLGDAAQVAWSFATIFVGPLIAVEGLDAGSARQRSVQLVKESWRAETGGLGALRAALLIPGILFYLDGKLLASGHVHSVAAKVLLGAVLLVGFGVVATAGVVRQVFAVELYRNATTTRNGATAPMTLS